MSVIILENVRKIYQLGETKVEALRDSDAETEEGEFFAVMGPSGSEKNSLMNMIGAKTFSFLIGTISGILPARKAVKLPPATALRYE